jgi:hypothetical protein
MNIFRMCMCRRAFSLASSSSLYLAPLPLCVPTLTVNIREHTINRAEIANCGAPGCLIEIVSFGGGVISTKLLMPKITPLSLIVLRSLAAYINRNRKPSLNQKTATQSELHRSFLDHRLCETPRCFHLWRRPIFYRVRVPESADFVHFARQSANLPNSILSGL